MGPDPHRLKSLDGLRGLLALDVVMHHCMLAAPGPASFRAQPVLWLVTYTPLHVFWAGTESVYAFFVLSGFVLVMPWVDGCGPSWRVYFPRRLLRLYLPIIGAAIFAYAVLLAFPRTGGSGVDAWTAMHGGRYGFTNFLGELTVLHGTSEQLDAPFWSLIWEIVFSLMLPLAILLLRLRRAPAALVLIGLLLLTWWAQQRWDDAAGVHRLTIPGFATFLPMFGVGVIMATNRDVVRRAVLAATTSRVATLLTWASAMAAFLWRFIPPLPATVSPTASVAGAACIIALFAYSDIGIRIGTARITEWLGRRSFSIYLVHFPIVITLAFALRSGKPWILLVTAVPIALIAAAQFYRLVERPAHEFSRMVGNALTGRPSFVEALHR